MTHDQADLFQYYEERAPEYEAFYHGEFPVAFDDPDRYRNDTLAVSRLVGDTLSGRCLDIACGTAFWLPHYHAGCSCITLVDQSLAVLEQAHRKIADLGIEDKTEIL